MKNTIAKIALLFTAVTGVFTFATILLVLSSCQKKNEEIKSDWTCTCRYRHSVKDTTVKFLYRNQTKEAASKACDQQEVYLQSIYGPTGTSCSNGF
jgi:hypothetical protein